MLNINEGLTQIEYGDEVYTLTPSFFNIDKLGSPRKIIDVYRALTLKNFNFINAYVAALEVIEACGGLPFELTGGLTYSFNKSKSMIIPGAIHHEEIIIIAEHLMMHAVSGTKEQVKESKDRKSSEAINEFDAAKYVLNATESLGMTNDEAWQLSMTKFARLSRAKYFILVDRGEIDYKPSSTDAQKLLERQKERLKARGKKQ